MATTSSLVIVVALWGLHFPELVLVDRVDLIEINHYYDEQGRHVFDQTIYYDWCPMQCRFHVRAWRLVKSSSQLPTKDANSNTYIATWHDGGILRRVTSKLIRETWTQYDPELAEQEFLPKDQRRDLSKPMGSVIVPSSTPTAGGSLSPASHPR